MARRILPGRSPTGDVSGYENANPQSKDGVGFVNLVRSTNMEPLGQCATITGWSSCKTYLSPVSPSPLSTTMRAAIAPWDDCCGRPGSKRARLGRQKNSLRVTHLNRMPASFLISSYPVCRVSNYLTVY